MKHASQVACDAAVATYILLMVPINVLSAVVKENKHHNTKDTKCQRGYAEINLRHFISVRGEFGSR